MDMDDKGSGGVVQTPVGSTITLNKCVLDTLKLKFNPDGLDSVNDIVGCGK
jgi:putative ABC transport system substrate-binding protein